MKTIGIIFSLLILSGCAAYSLVPAGKIDVDSTYSFTTSKDWSSHIHVASTNFTREGVGLQRIRAENGIEDGDTMFGRTNKTMPEYKKSMSLLDIRDFILDSFTSAGILQVEETEFRPANFGPWPGFRTEIEFSNKNGLRRKMMIAGMKHNDKLYVMYYQAPKIYYFDKNIGDFEEMLNTIQPIKK